MNYVCIYWSLSSLNTEIYWFDLDKIAINKIMDVL